MYVASSPSADCFWPAGENIGATLSQNTHFPHLQDSNKEAYFQPRGRRNCLLLLICEGQQSISPVQCEPIEWSRNPKAVHGRVSSAQSIQFQTPLYLGCCKFRLKRRITAVNVYCHGSSLMRQMHPPGQGACSSRKICMCWQIPCCPCQTLDAWHMILIMCGGPLLYSLAEQC